MELVTFDTAKTIASDIDCNRMIDDTDNTLLTGIMLGSEPPLNRIPANAPGASAYIINDATLNNQGLYKVIN